MTLKIRKLGHALGAEVMDVDIGKPLDDATVSEIRSAFLEHCLLVFRGHPFDWKQHAAFSRRFGAVDNYETHRNRLPDSLEVTAVVSRPTPDGKAPPGRFSGEEWHTDSSHLPAPCMASLLHGIELPTVGGDTMFCNMYLAYDSLSDGMKKLIEGLHGVHMEGKALARNLTPEQQAQWKDNTLAAAHPLVRVHPETGRKSLFVCETIKTIVGMTPDESKPLIQFLTQHAVRPQNVYRHTWQQHDLVMWDNRCLLHKALGDFDRTQVRYMEKTTIAGTPFGYAYDGPLN